LQTSLGEADLAKKRLAIERADLEKQLNDGENALRNLSKLRTSLSTQVTMTGTFLLSSPKLSQIDRRIG
jgi:hypothetical protein